MTKGRQMRKERAIEKADAESGMAGDATESFDGQLPSMLPELQWPEEFSCRMGEGAKRRVELTNRAYSVAVYAHADHFAPRRESLLAEPTKRLFGSEKEVLLRLFEKESYAVLGSLREWLGPMRPIPPAERIVLLNDYQVWAKQVKELLREAVFAGEPEAWNQDLLHLLRSRKPDEPSAREAFRHLVEKPVFYEHMYIEKFTELFLAQMQLEQRLGLMSDIALDLIRAYEARMRDKRKVDGESSQKLEVEAEATEPGHEDQPGAKPKLLPCHTTAYDSCQWVNKEQPALVPHGMKRFSQEMYEYVRENYPTYNDLENPIPKPSFESWCRYIRLCEQRGYKGGTQAQQPPRSAVSRSEAEDLGHLTNKFGKPD